MIAIAMSTSRRNSDGPGQDSIRFAIGTMRVPAAMADEVKLNCRQLGKH